ncbi:MAG: ABC transporter permease [Thiobacillaceae bacterium]|jgi:putative ABC transport system permease protein|nr:ABC transporter permease [Thiobacillaceae bacterium]
MSALPDRPPGTACPSAIPALSHLLGVTLLGHWRGNLGRVLLSVLGIALGVAMGLAVELIHQVAVDDFAHSARRLSGQADLVLRGDGVGFPEALYPRLVADARVAAASPGVEATLTLPGRSESLKVLGLDPFRARALNQPGQAWLGGAAAAGMDRFSLLDPDAIALTEAAAGALGLAPGDSLPARAGTGSVRLRVVAVLPGAAGRHGLMDIAGAQWLFGEPGRIHRLDLRLAPGVDRDLFARELLAGLPPGVRVEAPEAPGSRAAEASRAYRVNLGVLAGIALFTGLFLVFTTQWLSVLRRRPQFALLRTLGATRGQLRTLLLTEAGLLGLLGAGLGAALGVGLAAAGLAALGGDLGAGYFAGLAPELRVPPGTLAAYLALGVGAALVGAWLPAREAARMSPARGLRPGDAETWLRGWQRPGPGLLLLGLGAALPFAPPLAGIPVFAYAAIALLILGAAALLPWLLARLGGRLPRPAGALSGLALARLTGAPGQAALAVAAIVVSVALVTAMAVMVTSFRDSVEAWLHQVLRADVYARSGRAEGSGYLDAAAQARLAALPGVAAAEFLRHRKLHLDPARPPVDLMARPISPATAGTVLPLREVLDAPLHPGTAPAWVSEAGRDLHGWRLGERFELPLGDARAAFTVAGVWRDYGRQHGTAVIDLAHYRRLTGDAAVNDAALWVTGMPAEAVARQLRQEFGPGLEVRLPGEVRRLSLAAFDRSFAVTYALEAVAVLVGLFGVSAVFSAQSLVRRAEFGVLRHLGMTRRQVGGMIAAEAALLALAGILTGALAGLAASLVLVAVVNPQSFHWSMDLRLPAGQLALFYAALLVLAALTALASSRAAMRGEAVLAAREE